jgi:hypothetical protein
MTTVTVGDLEAVPCDGCAIDVDVGEVALRHAFGVDTPGAIEALQRSLDVLADPLDHR